MFFKDGQLDARDKTGITTQKGCARLLMPPEGSRPTSNAWNLAAIARIAVALPFAPLPRSLPHQQVKSMLVQACDRQREQLIRANAVDPPAPLLSAHPSSLPLAGPHEAEPRCSRRRFSLMPTP
jgi:hypothetical protein